MNGKPRAILGIDPGKSKTSPGAAALWSENNWAAFYDWTTKKVAFETVRSWSMRFHIEAAGLEKIWSKPINGHRGNAQLAENVGAWRMLLIVLGIDWIEVAPQTWQAIIPAFMRDKTKQSHVEAAKYLIPGSDRFFDKKKYHGRADALLIAYYVKSRVRTEKRLFGGNHGN